MEVLKDAVTPSIYAIDNIKDLANQFDLEKENYGIFTNTTLLALALLSLVRNRTVYDLKQTFNKTYDYVIVGAGTAGSVLANRLTEKCCISVLVLEAGDEPPILTDIPSFSTLFYRSPIDWAYKTTPQKYAAFSHIDNRIILNNGKVVGGSSVINFMHAVRGNSRNYDQWAAEGAEGWSYKDVLPYFLKLEDNQNIEEEDQGYHRKGGPMTFEKINYSPEIKLPIIEALTDLGYELRDANGRRQTGIFDLQATVRNQQRCSTAKAYLNPARTRPNLDVLTKAFARKILISKKSKKAYGVQFDHGGATHIVRAKREVIVSNGAIRTPQLLILSGIGPREQLEKLNISVVADLPVGKNLMDHFGSNQVYTVKKTIPNVYLKNLNPTNILDYITNRRGPLCSPTQTVLLAFVNGVENKKEIDFPEQQLFFNEFDVVYFKLYSNLKPEVYERAFKPYLGRSSYMCSVCTLQPYGRGEITLNSTDPYDMPLINTNYHSDERDLRRVVEGLKVCNAVARNSALKRVQAEPLQTILPGCEEFVGNEDKYLTCVARRFVVTIWHYSGTARMGHKDDPRSVVDPQLRVIGVRHLRVVNAAVFPIIPSGNTNVPTMMVAEKASDMIKKCIKCKDDRC